MARLTPWWSVPRIFWTAMACIYGHDRFIGAESKMSREARDEESSRIQWIKRWIERIHPRTQLPAFGLGFQASKASSIKDLSSSPSRPVAQKRQVLMAARKVTWSCRSSICARSVHGHRLNLGLFIRIGSNFSTSPKRTVGFPTSFRLIASRIVLRIGRSRIFNSSNKNLSLTFRNPPFFTTSPMADTNLLPNFSLWAHSVSSSTLQHSCSSGTGQRDVNLSCIAHGAFTFYNVLSIPLGLRIVVDVLFYFHVLYSTTHMYDLCIYIDILYNIVHCLLHMMHYIYIYYIIYHILYIRY